MDSSRPARSTRSRHPRTAGVDTSRLLRSASHGGEAPLIGMRCWHDHVHLGGVTPLPATGSMWPPGRRSRCLRVSNSSVGAASGLKSRRRVAGSDVPSKGGGQSPSVGGKSSRGPRSCSGTKRDRKPTTRWKPAQRHTAWVTRSPAATRSGEPPGASRMPPRSCPPTSSRPRRRVRPPQRTHPGTPWSRHRVRR